MKRLAVHIAAEEVVAAYRDIREHPSLEADQRLEGCISLLSLRLDVYERRERATQTRRVWWINRRWLNRTRFPQQ